MRVTPGDLRLPSIVRHKRFGRIAAAVVLASCVDSPVGPGDQAPATVTVRVTLPAATPAAWSPIGETVYLAVRRAGRVEPIADTTFVVLDSLGATFDVPLAYAVERFVVSAEVRYDGLVLFLGFEALQLRAAGDTALTLPTIYVGPGARAASFVLGVSDSTLSSLDTASLIRVVRDSAGQVIPNVPARFVTARPTLIAVDTAGVLTARPGTLDTARVTGFPPTATIVSAGGVTTTVATGFPTTRNSTVLTSPVGRKPVTRAMA